jgi:hypothetical protein
MNIFEEAEFVQPLFLWFSRIDAAPLREVILKTLPLLCSMAPQKTLNHYLFQTITCFHL